MTLKELSAFYWAATSGSFAIAASRLHVAQSTLSKRIAQLETTLGCELFNRNQRRAVLTPDGKALLPQVRILLNHTENIVATIGNKEIAAGMCKFGVGEIAASSWLPRFVADVKNTYPQITLEPHVNLGFELESKLIKGELDFAMIANAASHPMTESALIAEMNLIWVAASKLDCQGKYVEDLSHEHPVLCMHENAGINRIFHDWKKRANCPNISTIVCNNIATIAGLASASLGLALLPKGWAQPLLQQGILKLLPSTTHLESLKYYFHWRADDERFLIKTIHRIAKNNANYDTSLLLL